MLTYRVTKATETTRKPWRVEAQDRAGRSNVIGTYETRKQANVVRRLMVGPTAGRS